MLMQKEGEPDKTANAENYRFYLSDGWKIVGLLNRIEVKSTNYSLVQLSFYIYEGDEETGLPTEDLHIPEIEITLKYVQTILISAIPQTKIDHRGVLTIDFGSYVKFEYCEKESEGMLKIYPVQPEK